MGAWIEMCLSNQCANCPTSHPTMGAWIEIFYNCHNNYAPTSHPTMGAWIEIIREQFRTTGY